MTHSKDDGAPRIPQNNKYKNKHIRNENSNESTSADTRRKPSALGRVSEV